MTTATKADLLTSGLSCRRCGSVFLRTKLQRFRDDTEHVRCECGDCGAFVRYLPRSVVRVQYDRRPGHPAFETPPAGTRYGGWLRQGDGLWKPVALADSLEACWDILLSTWQKGDLMVMPTEPARPGEEGEEGEA